MPPYPRMPAFDANRSIGPMSTSVRSMTASTSASTVTSAVIGRGHVTDPLGRRHGAVGVAVHHDDGPRPLGGEPAAQRPPDAAGAAGDDADAITELHAAHRTYARLRTGGRFVGLAARRLPARRGQPAPTAARIVASADARRSAPHGSGISTGTSTPASDVVPHGGVHRVGVAHHVDGVDHAVADRGHGARPVAVGEAGRGSRPPRRRTRPARSCGRRRRPPRRRRGRGGRCRCPPRARTPRRARRRRSWRRRRPAPARPTRARATPAGS